MAANPVHLMTVAELLQLPDSEGEFTYELHRGELVRVTRPKAKRYRMQRRLRDLLLPHAEAGSLVDIELAFRPLPEYELRVADTAFVSAARWAEVDPDGYLSGAPELVIEILSPSNTAAEMFETEQVCIENGCKEFWVVDIERKLIRVSTPDNVTRTYRTGQLIPLPLFGGAGILVNDAFGSSVDDK